MFEVGQFVIRVPWRPEEPGPLKAEVLPCSVPRIGEVVTIRATTWWGGELLLMFVEHDNSHLAGSVWSRGEPGFNAKAFRPLRDSALDVFRSMLAPTPSERQVEEALAAMQEGM